MTPPMTATAPLEVFFSYSHKDARLRDKLITHLSTLKRQGIITEWHDRKISAGTEWAGQISEHLSTAQIILLLVSQDFIASDYCYDIEMKVAMERHEAGEARVIPVILRPTDWEGVPFARLQALPTEGKPITRWPNQDLAFVDVAKGIRRVAEELRPLASPLTPPADEPADRGQALVAPATRQAPYQLRPPVADFVGREREVDALIEALHRSEQSGGMVILRGMGGVGKTELAFAVAQRLAEKFPDGQIFLELGGVSDTPLSAEQALHRVTQAFDIQAQMAAELYQLEARYRSELYRRRVLIVADDAKDAEQVRRLMPPAGCALVITTRERFTLPGAATFDLQTLSQDAAEKLVLDICPRIGDAAPSLVRLCGLLPLALRVSASVLANSAKDVDVYLKALADERTRLMQMHDPSDRALDVEAALRLSYDAMGEAAQTVLRHISVFSASFALEAAKAIVDLGKVKAPASQEINTQRSRGRVAPPALADVLDELYSRSLVEYDTTTRRYSLHELVRTFGADQMTPAERGRFRRYAVHYSTIALMAEALYHKGGEYLMQGLALFDRERVHIDTALHWIRRNRDDELLLIYGPAIGELGGLRYHPRHDLIPIGEEVLATAQRYNRREPEMAALNILGNAYNKLGEAHQAATLFTEALEFVRTMRGRKRQRRAEAGLLLNLGSCCYDLGDIRRAIELYEQSLAIMRELDDQQGEEKSLGNLGACYTNLGDIRRAIELHQQSLAIGRKLGDRQREAASLSNLGVCYGDLGDIRRAIELHQQSLAIGRELGDRQGEANTLTGLGNCYYGLGDIQRAIELHEQSLRRARELNNRQGEARSLGNLGLCYAYEGEPVRAIERGEEALQITRELGIQPAEGYALRCLGVAYVAAGKIEQAIEAQEQAVTIARAVEHPRLEGLALNHLGEIYLQQGDTQRAVEHFEQTLLIMQRIGDRQHEAISSWNLGEALAGQGQLARAAELMQARVDFERAIGHALLDEHARRLAEVRECSQQEDRASSPQAL
jgi:tetratricopeptide (TPR) repeat protein